MIIKYSLIKDEIQNPSSNIYSQILILRDHDTMDPYCQAYMIYSDLVLTARHCIRPDMIIRDMDDNTMVLWSGYINFVSDLVGIQIKNPIRKTLSHTQIGNFVR